MKISEIIKCIETFAPLALQESYDNAGLICGDSSSEVKSALLCLDSTEAVIDEAIKNKCGLIIAHHPIVFSGIKKLTGKTYIERVLIKAIKNNIAIYAAHTNLDNVKNGVNAKIADKLGLVNPKILAPKSDELKKLITFSPASHADEVRQALFAAGAGHIGNYEECSFNSEGVGTFKAQQGANPFVGKKGVQHREKEIKIELVFPAWIQARVINALLKAHPYEEVAYDIIKLVSPLTTVGAGLIAELKKPMDEVLFLKHVKKVMKAGVIRYTNLLGKKVQKVAVCGGSGSFLLNQAISAGADVFITSDFKYHQFFDADNKLVIADIGHYESEQFTPEIFYAILKQKFPKFAVRFSVTSTNPVKYI